MADPNEVEVRDCAPIKPQHDGDSRQRMRSVREAIRLRRLARGQRLLHGFYDEHNLLAEAVGARREMMHLLRTACSSWRRALGLSP